MSKPIQQHTLWHEVRDHITDPFRMAASTPQVLCSMCTTQHLNIVGIPDSVLPINGLPSSPGVVIACGHMFCTSCWDWAHNHMKTAFQQIMCPIPACIEYHPQYSRCKCYFQAAPIPANGPATPPIVNFAAIAHEMTRVPLTLPECPILTGPSVMCKPCQQVVMDEVVTAVMSEVSQPSHPEMVGVFAEVGDKEVLRAELRKFTGKFYAPSWVCWECDECHAGQRMYKVPVRVKPMTRMLLVTVHPRGEAPTEVRAMLENLEVNDQWYMEMLQSIHLEFPDTYH